MKKLLGVDVTGNATLTPGSSGVGKIVFTGPDLELNQILVVTNVTRNQIIYNFASSSYGVSSYSNNELILLFDTSTYSANDELQAFIDVDADTYPSLIDMSRQSSLSILLTRIGNIMMSPLGYAKDTQRYRATTVLESGTVTTVSTVTTVTTVSTVTGVTNLTNLNGLAADRLVLNQNYSAWAAVHRSRIT